MTTRWTRTVNAPRRLSANGPLPVLTGLEDVAAPTVSGALD